MLPGWVLQLSAWRKCTHLRLPQEASHPLVPGCLPSELRHQDWKWLPRL